MQLLQGCLLLPDKTDYHDLQKIVKILVKLITFANFGKKYCNIMRLDGNIK